MLNFTLSLIYVIIYAMEILSHYWSQILTLGGIIYSYATLKSELSETQKELEEVKVQIREINPIFLDIKERLARIETKLEMLNK